MAVKTRVIKIGNSQGVRIPKALLEQANLGDEVELEISHGKLLIKPASSARAGWQAAFSQLRIAEDKPEWPDFSNEWDETEWEW